MKNIKISDEIHKELKEWCEHKEIMIVDIIDKLINTGLMTEKYGLSFFQTIIEKEGYVSKDKHIELENELKKQFYEKGLKMGHELGIKDGIKQFQKQKNKTEELMTEKSLSQGYNPIIDTTMGEEKKEPVKIEEKIIVKEIPQYNPDDIYSEEKNTRFIRLEEKRKKL